MVDVNRLGDRLSVRIISNGKFNNGIPCRGDIYAARTNECVGWWMSMDKVTGFMCECFPIRKSIMESHLGATHMPPVRKIMPIHG